MNPIKVTFALGIGDSHWALMKLKALKEYHGGAPIHAHINEDTNHHTVGYLAIHPYVDKALLDHGAFKCVHTEMQVEGTSAFAPHQQYMDPKWTTVAGCHNWTNPRTGQTYDYLMVPNGHLEQGRHIDQWMPELKTDYGTDFNYDQATIDKSNELMPEPGVLLYLSGGGPNMGFHGNWWTPEDWVEVISLLNDKGMIPYLVGAPSDDDLTYGKSVMKSCAREGALYKNIIGKTTIPEYLHLISRAKIWVGLNSGGGIVSASMGTPTLMMWTNSDIQHNPSCQYLHPGMQRSWLTEGQCRTYRTLSYGDPNFTPARTIQIIEEIIR